MKLIREDVHHVRDANTGHVMAAFQKKVAKCKEQSEEHFYHQHKNSKNDVFIFSQIDHTTKLVSCKTTEFSDFDVTGNKIWR